MLRDNHLASAPALRPIVVRMHIPPPFKIFMGKIIFGLRQRASGWLCLSAAATSGVPLRFRSSKK